MYSGPRWFRIKGTGIRSGPICILVVRGLAPSSPEPLSRCPVIVRDLLSALLSEPSCSGCPLCAVCTVVCVIVLLMPIILGPYCCLSHCVVNVRDPCFLLFEPLRGRCPGSLLLLLLSEPLCGLLPLQSFQPLEPTIHFAS